MLSINDLKNGTLIIINSDPYIVMNVSHLHIGRGGSSIQTKIKNLRTGQVFERNYKPSDEFEEGEAERMKSLYLYESRGVYWFNELGNPKNRFSLSKDDLGEDITNFLKPNLEVVALKFAAKGGEMKIIGIEMPIKVDYRVVEAPPSVKGNTAQGGNKTVMLETGAKILTPLFVNEGDVVRVNTQTGDYVERVTKM